MAEYSISEALATKNLLHKRIIKLIKDFDSLDTVEGKNKIIRNSYTIEDFNKQVKSTYDKINDLIEQRHKLITAIMLTNASTKIKIDDKEMTISEAIALQETIEYKKDILERIRTDLSNTTMNLDSLNETVDRKLTSLLNTMYANKDNKESIDTTEFSKNFKENNLYKLVDPLNITKEIAKLDEYIDKFENKLNYKLSEINSITKIEI